MLCTNSYDLLMSARGRTALNYQPTSNPPKYNPTAKGLVLTWDIFMQDYRAVSTESCELIAIIPATDAFWSYYSDKLTNMSPDQKMAFMSV